LSYRNQYVPKAISGISGHLSSTPTVAFRWQTMTSYWCSIVTWSRWNCCR